MPVCGGGRHAGPQTGERAGTTAHHDRVEVGHRQFGVGERGQHVRREPFGVRAGIDGDPFGEDREIVTPHDPRGDGRSGGVEGQDQAHEPASQVAMLGRRRVQSLRLSTGQRVYRPLTVSIRAP